MFKSLMAVGVFLGVLLAMASGAPGAPAPETVSAVTYNIRYGSADDGANAWDKRRDLCIGVLKALDADIIGLQEALAFQVDEIRAKMPGYTLIGVGRDDGLRGGEASPLLVRTDRFAIDQSGTVWLSDTPDKPGSMTWGNGLPRICTWARLIDLHSGKALWIYNTHLDHRSLPSRKRSVELIASLIAERGSPDEPVVVMGDMNSGEGSVPVRYLRGEVESASGLDSTPPSPRLIDTFRAIHPDATRVGTYSGFRNDDREGDKIDHVLVSPFVAVVDAGIDRTRGPEGAYPSDHDAVWAVLDLNRPE
jgi:endonuclease/exonuclease/phosphatase family metal-dependent hydrolase